MNIERIILEYENVAGFLAEHQAHLEHDGLYFQTNSSLETNTAISLELHFNDLKKTIELNDYHVVWTSSTRNRHGFWSASVGLTPAQKKQLLRSLNRLKS
ncbi:hypothetical protein ACFL27_11355 [candidate division CSSED10-310 bacterium]|uniref:Uncharacterized protein n=1 Tax=candidate division CSSED10-310 bacterium TaxID=2855610 RepID=A0ABV6YX60_UNCC1